MAMRCPRCGSNVYPTSSPRRRGTDPTARQDLPQLPPEDRWLTVEQVADEVGLKPDTINKYSSEGYFPKADTKWRRRNYWKLSTIHRWWQDRASRIQAMPVEGWPAKEPFTDRMRGRSGRFIKATAKIEIIVET